MENHGKSTKTICDFTGFKKGTKGTHHSPLGHHRQPHGHRWASRKGCQSLMPATKAATGYGRESNTLTDPSHTGHEAPTAAVTEAVCGARKYSQNDTSCMNCICMHLYLHATTCNCIS